MSPCHWVWNEYRYLFNQSLDYMYSDKRIAHGNKRRIMGHMKKTIYNVCLDYYYTLAASQAAEEHKNLFTSFYDSISTQNSSWSENLCFHKNGIFNHYNETINQQEQMTVSARAHVCRSQHWTLTKTTFIDLFTIFNGFEWFGRSGTSYDAFKRF